MKTFEVTVCMDSGTELVLNSVKAKDRSDLINTLLMEDGKKIPLETRFSHAKMQDGSNVCFCVGKVDYIVYKEITNGLD